MPNFPAATFIQGAMFIPDSRVDNKKRLFSVLFGSKKTLKSIHFVNGPKAPIVGAGRTRSTLGAAWVPEP